MKIAKTASLESERARLLKWEEDLERRTERLLEEFGINGPNRKDVRTLKAVRIKMESREKELDEREKSIKQEELDVSLRQFDLRMGNERLAKEQERLRDEELSRSEMGAKISQLQKAIRKQEKQLAVAEADARTINQVCQDAEHQLVQTALKIDQIGKVLVSSKSIARWLLKDRSPWKMGWDTVATIGSGGLSKKDLDDVLKDSGVKVVGCGGDVEVLVVGRSGWSHEALENHVCIRDQKPLKVFSQEMFLLSAAIGVDPFVLKTHVLLEAFAKGHPAIEFLQSRPCKWPKVDVVLEDQLPADAHLDVKADKSPLMKMGYTVRAKGGISESERRGVLETCFTGELEWVESDEYMRYWGVRGTQTRLWRMAHHLAWLARSRSRSSSMRLAVEKWVQDLTWLKERYYKKNYSFRWPG